MLADLQGSDQLKALLKDQYQSARIEAIIRWNNFLAGRGTLDIALGSFRRLLQAQFDLSNKKEDRIAALEANLRRLQAVEKKNKDRFDTKLIDLEDYEVSRFFRVRQEILLEKAKAAGAVPDL
jgi:hypothetical protein